MNSTFRVKLIPVEGAVREVVVSSFQDVRGRIGCGHRFCSPHFIYLSSGVLAVDRRTGHSDLPRNENVRALYSDSPIFGAAVLFSRSDFAAFEKSVHAAKPAVPPEARK